MNHYHNIMHAGSLAWLSRTPAKCLLRKHSSECTTETTGMQLSFRGNSNVCHVNYVMKSFVWPNTILWLGLTWTGTVMCLGVPDEAWSTELALGPGGVVDAVEAVAGVGVTELGGALRVCIPAAVTWNTNPGCFEEASAALITLWAAVLGKALVTHWGATGICTGTDR